jgi:S-disulfanyl-L-cysteine oxidoreductase SoxD
MSHAIARSVIAALSAAIVLHAMSARAAAPQGTTIWEGVYTDAQASRGEADYKGTCGHCHRDNLAGGGSEAGAPALVGPVFTVRWRDKPLTDIFMTIGRTMPQNDPDALTPQRVVDIMSFILRENAVPSGSTELPADVRRLNQILFTKAP